MRPWRSDEALPFGEVDSGGDEDEEGGVEGAMGPKREEAAGLLEEEEGRFAFQKLIAGSAAH